MEIQQNNQPQTTMPQSQQSKRWYKHKGIISIVILFVVAIIVVFVFFRSLHNFISADQAMSYIYDGRVDFIANTHRGFTIHLKDNSGNDSGSYQIKPAEDGKFSRLFFNCGAKCKGIGFGQE